MLKTIIRMNKLRKITNKIAAILNLDFDTAGDVLKMTMDTYNIKPWEYRQEVYLVWFTSVVSLGWLRESNEEPSLYSKAKDLAQLSNSLKRQLDPNNLDNLNLTLAAQAETNIEHVLFT